MSTLDEVLINTGQYRSASELAAHEKITDSHVARILSLTLRAPAITQAILEGRQPKRLKLATLLRGGPLASKDQRREFGFLRRSLTKSSSRQGYDGGASARREAGNRIVPSMSRRAVR